MPPAPPKASPGARRRESRAGRRTVAQRRDEGAPLTPAAVPAQSSDRGPEGTKNTRMNHIVGFNQLHAVEEYQDLRTRRLCVPCPSMGRRSRGSVGGARDLG